MAIKTVPNISGPNFGGVIYGLSVNIGYSSEPTKLVLDIVNKDGVYATPVLNRAASVSFGNFNFNGVIWSYDQKETASEKTLQVTLVDNSIILDRYYVLLWKRGLLDLQGNEVLKSRTFDFSEESILVPKQNNGLQGFSFAQFEEKRLGNQTIQMKSRALDARRVGNAILVGKEKFANSACDIPDTYYTFDDLRGVLPINGAFPSNNEWKATHEGTLREVLSSWASDLGFDYYWDFSSNQLIFFSVSRGIANVPNITAPNIISKEVSASMEGTFRQYGIGYTQVPREALKTIPFSRSVSTVYSVNPYPLDYFLKRVGAPQSITGLREKWGGQRSQTAFTQAGLLGFVSRSLRDLHSFANEYWEVLGYEIDSGIQLSNADKAKLISLLRKNGFEMVDDLETFDAVGLPNYIFSFINRDVTIADKWYEVEQQILTYHGRYYRIPDSSGSFFYCNSNFTAEIEISVDPEGQVSEENSEQFAGKKIFDRNGRLSHDSVSAQEILGYEKLKNEIENCAPIHIDLKESGLLDVIVTAGLLSAKNSTRVNTLVIHPKNQTFVREKLGFSSNMLRSSHPTEQTYIDIKNANTQNGKKNCQDFETKLEKGSCESAEERARQNAIKAAGGGTSEPEDDLVSGLVSNSARACNILLNKGSVRIHAPSDMPYRVICRYNINVNKISSVGAEHFLFSSGTPGTADDVAEIRISMENVTDPEEDSFQKARRTPVPKPVDAVNSTHLQSVKYVIAGEPPSGLTLSPSAGLSNLDISLSSDGFTTSATFSSKAPKPAKADMTTRKVQSQFNRTSYNAS
jgi:hypothetical protein